MSFFPHTDKATAEVGDVHALALGNLIVVALWVVAHIIGFLTGSATYICLGIIVLMNGSFFAKSQLRLNEASARDVAEKEAAGRAYLEEIKTDTRTR